MSTYWDEVGTVEVDGREFIIDVTGDDGCDLPWECCDGHGPVSEWTQRAKRPGERVLSQDGRYFRYYDWQEAAKMARRDGWNAEPYDAPGRIQRAVQSDFDFLRRFCEGQWCYLTVRARVLDEEGEPDDDSAEYCGMVESDDMDHVLDIGRENASEYLHRNTPNILPHDRLKMAEV